MTRISTLLAVVVAAASFGLTAPATGAATNLATNAVRDPGASTPKWPGPTSDNWSGYAGVTSSGFAVTYTSARWKVPSVATKNGFSSAWVGVDGYKNNALIQTGTEQDYYKKKLVYRAWWEILPANETVIPSLTITPGDWMQGTIENVSGSSWRITLADLSSGQSFTTTQTYTGPAASAEWILEAPTGPKGVQKLARYSTTEFWNITLGLNSAAPTDVGLVYPGEAIAMLKGKNQISTPSKPTGNAFNIAYGKKQPAAP